MIRRLQDIAPACARAWLRLYTSGMPADLRDARHADVNTDLWEHQHDAYGEGASRVAIAAEILLRTLVGVPDDLGWRREAMPARHGAVIEGRIGTVAISSGQMRWMGLCALLSGALMVGTRLVEIVVGLERTSIMANSVVWALLSILGVLGLYAQHRGDAGKAGSAGFILSLAGWACVLTGSAVSVVAIIFGLSGGFSVVAILLNLGWVVMIPLGLLLLGIGLPSPSRRVPLGVGCYLMAQVPLLLAVRALPDPFSSASILFGGDVSSVVLALGVAGIGYAVWSGTRKGSVSAGGASLTA